MHLTCKLIRPMKPGVIYYFFLLRSHFPLCLTFLWDLFLQRFLKWFYLNFLAEYLSTFEFFITSFSLELRSLSVFKFLDNVLNQRCFIIINRKNTKVQ